VNETLHATNTTPEADSQSLATDSDKPEPILALGLTFRPKPSQARLHPARRPDRRLLELYAANEHLLVKTQTNNRICVTASRLRIAIEHGVWISSRLEAELLGLP
jgi:hypothetical protein